MRLSKKQIAHLAMTIVRQLIEDGKIIVDDKNRLVEDIENVLIEEFLLEDKIDEEAKKILSEHLDEIRRSNIEYNELLKQVKRKLAKDKGVVL
ncbi:MAG: DUF507 family protein [Candidatus Aminicenantes bacterium]|nr:DUF507 family protein [Candidatus Aminicenantes bacterium]